MLLSKEIAVDINLAACQLKQYTATMLKRYKVGLTPEQFLLLDLLWNQGSQTQQQLANTMRKDKNSITKLVDALEKKGFIVRQRNTADKRSNIIVLTTKADNLKINAKETGISILDNVLQNIEEDELRNFLATLKKMSDNMASSLNE